MQYTSPFPFSATPTLFLKHFYHPKEKTHTCLLSISILKPPSHPLEITNLFSVLAYAEHFI